MRQYIELVQRILIHGQERVDRTGTGTISVFGTQSRYNLQDGFPLLTTKAVNFKAVVAELLWMLKGSTNTGELDAGIWDAWADEFGELGPIYGYQWRRWGEGNGNTFHKGFDQIADAINTLKTNPTSRRIIVSAWNVGDIPDMALPPCHLLFQFYVRPCPGEPFNGYLDCQMYQRSADVAVGVPFNIASYALLTHLIANECGMLAGELIHTIGDAHAYLDHVDGLKTQIQRPLRTLPGLIGSGSRPLQLGLPVDQVTSEDIGIAEYNPHPVIKFKVSV